MRQPASGADRQGKMPGRRCLRGWIYGSHVGCAWHGLPEKLEPLGRDVRRRLGEAGHVPAWPGEAGDDTAADRVRRDSHHDGDRRVARLTATAVGVAVVTMTSGLEPTSAAAAWGKSSALSA